LFEAPNTLRIALVEQVKSFIIKFNLTKKILVYMKMKARILPWAPFDLYNPYVRACFGYVMPKTYQYATLDDEKVCLSTKDMSLKKAL
jgi:hypothetical protein